MIYMTSRAVFFDRDGVINKEIGYLDSLEKVEIISGVSEAIKLLNENDFKVIIITNQSGIARGYFTEKTLIEINDFIKSELEKEHAKIDAIYYCPHHPDDKPKSSWILL
jgi:D-glycero-D-manno-heptose 1,7-bisphosphate phosphatase